MSVIGLPATIFRNFAIRQKIIRQKVFGNRNIGNLYSAKVNNESKYSAKYFLETDICHSSPQTDICQQTRHRKISISRSVIQKKENYCRMTNSQLQIFQMVNLPSKNLPNGRVAKLFNSYYKNKYFIHNIISVTLLNMTSALPSLSLFSFVKTNSTPQRETQSIILTI